MRAALYQHLTANCSSILSWHQPYTPAAETPKPYGVIVVEDELLSLVNSKGSFVGISIWPYFAKGSFVAVDNAVKEIKSLLKGAVLTTSSGNKFEIEYVGMGRDYYDDELKALTKVLEFRTPQVGK